MTEIPFLLGGRVLKLACVNGSVGLMDLCYHGYLAFKMVAFFFYDVGFCNHSVVDCAMINLRHLLSLNF
jgi:hypothetical protein